MSYILLGCDLKTFSLEETNALNPHCFCFDVLDTLDLRTIISQEAYVRP